MKWILSFMSYFSMTSIAMAKESDHVAKKLSQLPHFWELMGGFIGIFAAGFSIIKILEFWLKKAGYIKDENQEKLEKIEAKIKKIVELIELQNKQFQPIHEVLLPNGMSLDRTAFYRIVETLTDGKISKLHDILEMMAAQQRQNRQIISLLRYLAKKKDESSGAIDIIFDSDE